MIKKTTTFHNTVERKTFTILCAGVVLSILSYVFFIGVMSVSAAQMDRLEGEMQNLDSVVSGLEAEYLALGKDVTLSYAHSLGFEDPEDVAFATRKTFAVNLINEI